MKAPYWEVSSVVAGDPVLLAQDALVEVGVIKEN